MRKIVLVSFLIYAFSALVAQETIKNPLTFSGYLETYFSYDFGNPNNHLKPSFIYNYNRHNELNLNLGFAKMNYTKDNIRGNLAIMTGTYAQYNMVGEQVLLRNVLEANVGVKISKKHNLWIDAGIMPAHIGFESAVGRDNQTLTRSILADNSPYFEAGLKISYLSPSEKWYLAFLYLNGWQRIQKIDGNQTPAFGAQITYKPSTKSILNWSTFIGNEFPDIDRKWRYFNNLYAQFQISNKTNLTAGFDIGFQQMVNKSEQYDSWYAPILIVQHKPTDKIQMAVRAEYYADQKGVIIVSGTPNGFQTFGFSANFDYLVSDNVSFRIEARNLQSKDQVFLIGTNPSASNTFLTTSMAISF